MKEVYNLLLFLAICFLVYVLFRSFHITEGMTNNTSSSSSSVQSSSSGVAGNAAGYAASLKAATIKMQDTLLVSKYRTDYESAILNLDDFINNQMLTTALNVNQGSPAEAIDKLAKMQQAKTALNAVMKFVDGH